MCVRVFAKVIFSKMSAKVSRNRRNDKVPSIQKVSRNRKNNQIFDFVVLLFLDTFEYGKYLETGEMTKSLEKVYP